MEGTTEIEPEREAARQLAIASGLDFYVYGRYMKGHGGTYYYVYDLRDNSSQGASRYETNLWEALERVSAKETE